MWKERQIVCKTFVHTSKNINHITSIQKRRYSGLTRKPFAPDEAQRDTAKLPDHSSKRDVARINLRIWIVVVAVVVFVILLGIIIWLLLR